MKRALVLAALAASCMTLPPEEPAPRGGHTEETTPARAEPAVLYARDGTPVSSAGPVPPGGEIDSRQLGEGGGRMYILELYQSVIEERDSLSAEVAALTTELERMRQTLLEADARITELEGEVESLTIERQQLIDDNMELAARLTTAQIRRLQTEKILLEKTLSELRAEAPLAAADTSRQAGRLPSRQPGTEVQRP
jgi:hypothetical protein